MSTPYYNNRNIKPLISKNIIIIITARTIKIIKLPRVKKSKTLTKEEEIKKLLLLLLLILLLLFH